MATAADIGWSSYRSFEGPFYLGKHRYVLPSEPTESSNIIAVITKTEGGRYDAINAYDRCILSSGLVQWCEAGQYSVSDMLGSVSSVAMSGVIAGAPVMHEFRKNAKGRYRFFTLNTGEVDTLEEQQRLFLRNSNGQKGTWDTESKLYAKQWAAAVATVWEDPSAQRTQVEYTSRRLFGFCLPEARKVLDAAPKNNIGLAFRAAYLSFAANNPTWANRHLQKALQQPHQIWSYDWFVEVLRELTFGPQVVIYPHRYNAIRPVLEKLYNLNLPDFSTELEAWKKDQPHSFFFDTKEIQQALITLGYDLGPKGADGAYGQKTRDAVLLFEQMDFGEQNKVPPENVDGMMDLYTARKMEEVLENRGIELLT